MEIIINTASILRVENHGDKAITDRVIVFTSAGPVEVLLTMMEIKKLLLPT